MSEALLQTDSLSHRRNQSRVARDEAELEELLKQAGVPNDDESSLQQDTSEEVTEEESSSEEPVEQTVRTESDTEQKEERKAETQEEAEPELSAEEKSFKKRYSDIRKYMQEKEAEHKAELAELKKQLDSVSKGSVSDLTTKEEIEEWAKQNPKANSLIRALAEEQAAEQLKSIDSRLKEVEEMRTQARKEKAEAMLYSMHPDFDSIRNDDAFHDWAKEQPKWAQTALYDEPDDVKSVARVLDLYKADKGIKTKKPSVDKDAASSVKAKRAAVDPNDSSKYLTESMVAKMSIKEYEKRMDEIMEAQRSGRFIYDMSKK